MDFNKNYTLRRVALYEIDGSDETCRISCGDPSDAFVSSVKENGIICPPIVYESGGKYKIICGFKRMASLLKIRAVEADCLVFKSASPLERLRMNIFENVSSRALNAVEISRALNKLLAFIDKKDIIDNYCEVIGLKKSEFLYNKYIKFNLLIFEIKSLIAAGRLPIAAAFSLSGYSAQEQEVFVKIIEATKMGSNLISEAAELLFELSMQYGMAICDIYDKIEISSILNDEKRNSNEKTALVRARLLKMKRPMYEERLERFEKMAAAISKNKISINPFSYFEKDEISVKFNIRNKKSLDGILDMLKELKESKLADEFLEK